MATVTSTEETVNLQESIFSPTFLTPAVKNVLPSLLWSVSPESQYVQQNETDLKAYFAYFQQERLRRWLIILGGPKWAMERLDRGYLAQAEFSERVPSSENPDHAQSMLRG